MHRLITENSYIGCFADDVNGYVLTHSYYGPDVPPPSRVTDISVDKCFTLCLNSLEHDVQYAGLEAGNQCFCGREGSNYARLGQLEVSDCNIPCVGDVNQMCGGDSAIAIYDCKKVSRKIENILQYRYPKRGPILIISQALHC